MEVRLLGGSYHSKRYTIYDNTTSLHLPKKPKKQKWKPGDIYNFDVIVDIETEIYNVMKARQVYPLSNGRSRVHVKIAYVKQGSNIKPETFWKLAFDHETYETWPDVRTG